MLYMLMFSFLSPCATDNPISNVLLISVVPAGFFTSKKKKKKTQNCRLSHRSFLALSLDFTAVAYQTWPLYEERGFTARPAEKGKLIKQGRYFIIKTKFHQKVSAENRPALHIPSWTLHHSFLLRYCNGDLKMEG